MKGSILNQTVGAVVGTMEDAVDVAKEVGKEVVSVAGGAILDAINTTVQGGGENQMAR